MKSFSRLWWYIYYRKSSGIWLYYFRC